MFRALRTTAVLAALLLAACSGETRPVAPGEISAMENRAAQQGPEFVRRNRTAPEFQLETVTLAAVAGRGGEITLRFRDGSAYATFRVTPETMRGATLQGRPVPVGTAVEITMRPVDGDQFIVDLQPSGLRFNPRAPAELEFASRHAAVALRAGALGIWKQEDPEQPWGRVSPVEEDAQQATVRAKLDGFTRYALASGH